MRRAAAPRPVHRYTFSNRPRAAAQEVELVPDRTTRDTVILAEKPSQSRAYAEALTGRSVSGRGPFETPIGTIVTAQGHLRRYEEPRDRGLTDWSGPGWPDLCEAPPLVPRDRDAQRQLADIKALLGRASRIVIATDPDREGDAIGWNILALLRHLPPAVERMLCAEVDLGAIRRAFASLQPARLTRPRAIAANARARIDMLAGTNLTVAVCTALRPATRREVWPAGRVKTPTLWLVVQREREIKAFRPIDHFLLSATFAGASAKRIGGAGGGTVPVEAVLVHRPDPYLTDRRQAERMAAEARGVPGELVVDRQLEAVAPPLPFDKPSLLQAASRRLGWRPDTAAGVLQALYEAGHVTYPRSGCRKLSSADAEALGDVCAAVAARPSLADTARAIGQRPVVRRPRVIDDAAVAKASHTAIIPTRKPIDARAAADWIALYDLIARQYLCAFSPDGRDEVTKASVELTLDHALRLFSATARRRVEDGWRAIDDMATKGAAGDEAGAHDHSDDDGDAARADGSLPLGLVGGPVRCNDVAVVGRRTEPPRRYTYATLMGDMKGAHRWASDPALADILRTKDHPGLGTPATMEAIPLELAAKGLIEEIAPARKGSKVPALRAPDHSVELIAALEQAVPEFVRPDLTARLELSLMEIAETAEHRGAEQAADRLVAEYAGLVSGWFAAIRTLPPLPAGSAVTGPNVGRGMAAARPARTGANAVGTAGKKRRGAGKPGGAGQGNGGSKKAPKTPPSATQGGKQPLRPSRGGVPPRAR